MEPLAIPHPAAGLLQLQQPPLACWYGEPLAADAAAALCLNARHELQRRLCTGGVAYPLHVLQLACSFWRRSGHATGYTCLVAAGGRREQALLELVYGQLLASRKLAGAAGHLERGFALAAPWLSTREYFDLVRRHERLSSLRLSDGPAPAQGLQALLTEAAVTRRLRHQPRRAVAAARHGDTVG